MLVFAGLLLWQVAQTQHQELQEDAVRLADTLVARVDRQLLGFIWALQVLASSPALDRADVDALHRHAAEMKRILGSEIVVKEASGQQLVNTRIGSSGPLPVSLPEGDRKAIATRQPVVSDLFIGKTAQRPIVSVSVPIIRDGNVIGLINAQTDPARLTAVLRSSRAAAGLARRDRRWRGPDHLPNPQARGVCRDPGHQGPAAERHSDREAYGPAARPKGCRYSGLMRDRRSPIGASRSASRSP